MTSSSVDPRAPFVSIRGADPTVIAEEDAESPPFGEIYDAHFAFVWRMARRLGVPEVSLDDVIQEVFVFVYRHAAERPRGIALRSWLYGIVLNVARNHRPRTSSVEVPRLESDDHRVVVDPGPLPDELLARAQALEALDTILGALDEEKLEVFVLAELEGLSMPRIAKLLGINVNTAYARRRAARQALEEGLARHRARDAWRLR
jgi:RNA polymerase sigma-70 factor (ECF subfamily)